MVTSPVSAIPVAVMRSEMSLKPVIANQQLAGTSQQVAPFPLLKNCIWLVVRGMVKLEAVHHPGDPLLLGLAGPMKAVREPP